jgi:broad specificity phosphatase PhoE
VEEKAAMKLAKALLKKKGIKPGMEEYAEAVEAARKSVLNNPDFYDAPLSSLGKRDALRAQSELAGLHDRGHPRPTAVLTSPLLRTLETSAIIFPFHSCVQVREDLRERRTGLPCDCRQVGSIRERQQRFQQMDFTDVKFVDLEAEGYDEEPDSPKEPRSPGRKRKGVDWDSSPGTHSDSPQNASSSGYPKAGRIFEVNVDEKPEEKGELRERTAQVLGELFGLETSDEALGSRDHQAMALITHKGFLREMERGPLGQPEAAEFSNCEVRVYEITWTEDGKIEGARCVYSNASLCTLQLQRLPVAWLRTRLNSEPTDESLDDDEVLAARLRKMLEEYGELRQEPTIVLDQPKDEGAFHRAMTQ